MDLGTRWYVVSNDHPQKTGFVLGVLTALLMAVGEWLDPGFLKVVTGSGKLTQAAHRI